MNAPERPQVGAGTGRAAARFTAPRHGEDSAAAPAPASSAAPAAHKHDSRLIQKPSAQRPLPRTLWGAVTGVFWLAYLYLWTPVLTLLLWLLGVRTAASELYLRQHQVDPFLMLFLPATAAIVVALLLAWAEYNRWRFARIRGERRGAQPLVPLEEVAAALGADLRVAHALNAGRISVLHMDPQQAVPLGVTAVTPQPPAQAFPPPAPMPQFTRQLPPGVSWLYLLALGSIGVVIAVLALVSHGYRQIQSTAPLQSIEGTPGIDRPGLPAAVEAVQAPPPVARAAPDAEAAAAADAARERARQAKARAEAQRKRRAADAASATPRPLPGFSPKPPYPLDALRHQEGGLVTLRVQVSAEGRPTRVDVLRRSGHRSLDRAAVSTVRGWRFAPAKRKGKPVAAVVIVPVEFTPRH